MTLSREQRIARHKDFLVANWEVLAAYSWHRYQAEGRGLVVVMEDDIIHGPIRLAPLRLAYATKGSVLMSTISKHFEEKEWGWLADYNPDERVIVVIVRPDGGSSAYYFGGETRPSECYARRQAENN